MSMDRNKKDIASSIAKGIVGSTPYVGPLVAEVIGELIPNQRIDRIVDFVNILDEKVKCIEEELLSRKFRTPEIIDLFEDSIYQAARALSEERKGHIASLFKNSLTDKDLEHIHYKKLLALLSELNDVEILLLKYYSQITMGDKSIFWDEHKDALDYPRATFGTPREDVQSMVDKEALHESYENNLVRMGLLESIRNERKDVTTLGRLLLRSIDELDDD